MHPFPCGALRVLLSSLTPRPPDVHILSEFWHLNEAARPSGVLCVDVELGQKAILNFIRLLPITIQISTKGEDA